MSYVKAKSALLPRLFIPIVKRSIKLLHYKAGGHRNRLQQQMLNGNNQEIHTKKGQRLYGAGLSFYKQRIVHPPDWTYIYNLYSK